MIARIWHGTTPVDKSADYLRLMREVAIPDYRSTPGNRGAYVLHRESGGVAHFQMLTFWDSEESVTAFAGDDVTVAKYYDFDDAYLLEKEPRAVHYELHDA
ncbi:antibiotic biosynthesis monooxygenase [Nonomuraea deserti]|uniref:Antibiotic biosynthesis monooxygenase n=1 Tax=Nonomuraea deserti TaxID=1848322 RepID=A0A4R4UX75_9ACTN|nr:antibiotic biosynthesis monooxygenase [Nonomuraea deserti]TDC91429.1 antibiotic biosynthesis monooxygenase [Nonomuraea deserti]